MAAGLVAFALGIIVIFGWYINDLRLIQISESFSPMQYNTALGFVLAGAGLVLLSRPWRNACMVAGTMTTALGLLTLLQYLTGGELGLDQLFHNQALFEGQQHPGRMAPNTAFCFALSGMGLFTWGHRISGKPQFLILSAVGLFVLGLACASLLGHVGEGSMAFGWGTRTSMAVHTSVGFVIVALGILTAAWLGDLSDADPGQHWQPVALGLLGICLSLMLWQLPIDQERAKLHQETAVDADRMAYAVRSAIVSEASALSRKAARWDTSGGTPEDVWRADALNLVRGDQSFTGVLWVGGDDEIKWAEPMADFGQCQGTKLSRDNTPSATLRLAEARKDITVTSSIEIATGGLGFLVYVPISDGYLIGIFTYQDLIESAGFDQVLEDNALRLIDDGDVVYDGFGDTVSEPYWQANRKVRAYGRTWTVQAQPTAQHLSDSQGWFPAAILVGGLLMSLTLGGVLYLKYMADHRTRQREDELDQRKVIEEALSDSHQQLQRTLMQQQIMVSAVENTISPMVLSDMSGKVTRVNQAFLDLLDYTQEDELIGHHTSEIWTHQDVYDDATEGLRENRFVHIDAHLNRRDGTTCSVEVQAAIADDTSGKGMQIITSCIDLTARNEATLALEASNEELSRSNKELDDFAYIASHDLKEPLRGLTNYSSYLLDDYLDKLDE